MFRVGSASQKQWGSAEKKKKKEKMLHTVQSCRPVSCPELVWRPKGWTMRSYVRYASRNAHCTVLSVVCGELACCRGAPSTSTSNHRISQHTCICTCTYVRMTDFFFFSKPAPKSRASPTRNIEKNGLALVYKRKTCCAVDNATTTNASPSKKRRLCCSACWYRDGDNGKIRLLQITI